MAELGKCGEVPSVGYPEANEVIGCAINREQVSD